MKNIVINFIKSLFFFHAEILLRFKLLNLSDQYWSGLHLRQLILLGYKPSKTVNKVGFIISDQSSFMHIINIIKFMPAGSFEIVLLNSVNIFRLEHLKKTYASISLR
jgi:hypothetical protein